MSSNPYASPESDVTTFAADVQNTSIWRKSGRLSVLSYWARSMLLTFVGYGLIGIIVGAGAYFMGGGASLEQAFNLENLNPLLFIPVLIILIAMLWIGTCQVIKRFHDLNLSGWWALTLLIVIGFIALFIPSKGQPNRFGGWRQTRMWEKILGVIALLLYALMLIGPFLGLSALGGFGGIGALGA